MPETWTFNAHGDVPTEARDQIDLQDTSVPEETVGTVNVEGVTAELPGGLTVDGFNRVNVSVAGTDLDAPLNVVRLHWPNQDRDDLVETASDVATDLGMDPTDVEQWGTSPPENAPMGRGGQVRDDIEGLTMVELFYQEVAPGRATAIVNPHWPRAGEPDS